MNPKDVATQAMPDFRKSDFLKTMSMLIDKNMDSASAYLMSLSALTLGMECVFSRKASEIPLGAVPANAAFPLPVFYKVTAGQESEYFYGSISVRKRDQKMAALTKSKVHTRQALASAGIRTPFGGLAWPDNMTVLDELARAGVNRILVKPNDGSFGRGVIADITIDDARAHIQAHPDEVFVAEQYIVGTEYRIYTVGGEYSECFAKLRDHVIGNGRETLRELLAEKLHTQMNNPLCRARAIQNQAKDKFLIGSGFELDAVPKRGKFVWLTDNKIPNSYDGTYEPSGVGDEVRTLAHDVAHCINADCVAIDLIDRGGDGTYVLEVNSKAGISAACFPMNAAWNLRLPEAILRNSLPAHKDRVRRIKHYDYLRLVNDFCTQTGVTAFDAKDYVKFA